MSETPSKRRRKGRELFCPGEDPKDHCPYSPDSWGYEWKLEDFIDGWNEAEKQYNEEQKKQ